MSRDSARYALRTKILAAILGPVVVLGLLEIGLRVGGYRYDPSAEWTDRHDELKEQRVYAKHPDLLWTLRPSTSIFARDIGFHGVRTNSLGLRGPDLPGDRDPGELRVLCVGDSVTFGIGIPDGHEWPLHCAEALRASPELSGRRVTVVNAGVPGWTSVQGMRLLKVLRDIRPDVIVFWFGMNDAKAARGFPDSAQRPAGARGRKLLVALRSCRVFQLVQEAVSESRSDPGTRVSIPEFEAAVRHLLEEERRGGPRVIFVRTPHIIPETLREIDAVLERAEEVGARRLVGPIRLFSPWSPASAGGDRVGKLVPSENGPTLEFESLTTPAEIDLEKLRQDREMLVEYERQITRFLAALPERSLGREELFGDEPLGAVMLDNCHLDLPGTRLVGAAIAAEILRILGEPR